MSEQHHNHHKRSFLLIDIILMPLKGMVWLLSATLRPILGIISIPLVALSHLIKTGGGLLLAALSQLLFSTWQLMGSLFSGLVFLLSLITGGLSFVVGAMGEMLVLGLQGLKHVLALTGEVGAQLIQGLSYLFAGTITSITALALGFYRYILTSLIPYFLTLGYGINQFFRSSWAVAKFTFLSLKATLIYALGVLLEPILAVYMILTPFLATIASSLERLALYTARSFIYAGYSLYLPVAHILASSYFGLQHLVNGASYALEAMGRVSWQLINSITRYFLPYFVHYSSYVGAALMTASKALGAGIIGIISLLWEGLFYVGAAWTLTTVVLAYPFEKIYLFLKQISVLLYVRTAQAFSYLAGILSTPITLAIEAGIMLARILIVAAMTVTTLPIILFEMVVRVSSALLWVELILRSTLSAMLMTGINIARYAAGGIAEVLSATLFVAQNVIGALAIIIAQPLISTLSFLYMNTIIAPYYMLRMSAAGLMAGISVFPLLLWRGVGYLGAALLFSIKTLLVGMNSDKIMANIFSSLHNSTWFLFKKADGSRITLSSALKSTYHFFMPTDCEGMKDFYAKAYNPFSIKLYTQEKSEHIFTTIKNIFTSARDSLFIHPYVKGRFGTAFKGLIPDKFSHAFKLGADIFKNGAKNLRRHTKKLISHIHDILKQYPKSVKSALSHFFAFNVLKNTTKALIKTAPNRLFDILSASREQKKAARQSENLNNMPFSHLNLKAQLTRTSLDLKAIRQEHSWLLSPFVGRLLSKPFYEYSFFNIIDFSTRHFKPSGQLSHYFTQQKLRPNNPLKKTLMPWQSLQQQLWIDNIKDNYSSLYLNSTFNSWADIWSKIYESISIKDYAPGKLFSAYLKRIGYNEKETGYTHAHHQFKEDTDRLLKSESIAHHLNRKQDFWLDNLNIKKTVRPIFNTLSLNLHALQVATFLLKTFNPTTPDKLEKTTLTTNAPHKASLSPIENYLKKETYTFGSAFHFITGIFKKRSTYEKSFDLTAKALSLSQDKPVYHINSEGFDFAKAHLECLNQDKFKDNLTSAPKAFQLMAGFKLNEGTKAWLKQASEDARTLNRRTGKGLAMVVGFIAGTALMPLHFVTAIILSVYRGLSKGGIAQILIHIANLSLKTLSFSVRLAIKNKNLRNEMLSPTERDALKSSKNLSKALSLLNLDLFRKDFQVEKCSDPTAPISHERSIRKGNQMLIN